MFAVYLSSLVDKDYPNVFKFGDKLSESNPCHVIPSLHYDVFRVDKTLKAKHFANKIGASPF